MTIKMGDRVTVLTQDARPAYNGVVCDVDPCDRYVVVNDDTGESVSVPAAYVTPERKPEPSGQYSGEFVGAMLEASFPMELSMSGSEPVKVDYVVCETGPEDPGDGPQHEFKINIGEQWFTVTVKEEGE